MLGAAHGALQQLDVGLVLAGHMRVFKKDDFLAALVQHQFGNLRVAAERAALVAGDPGLRLRPAARPGHVVQALAGGAGGHAPGKARQGVEMLGGKGHHLVFQRVVGDQRRHLGFERKQRRGLGHAQRVQAGVGQLHRHPFHGAGQGGYKRFAVNHALAFERLGFGVDRGRVNRVHQKKHAVQRGLRRQATGHARHQAHQPAVAAIAHGVELAVQQFVFAQRVVGAAGGVQRQAQRLQAGLTGARPAQQAAVRAEAM